MMVAVTRPRDRAGETAKAVEKMGWTPLVVSAVEIVPRNIDPSIRLSDFDWLVVTSASAVSILLDHFGEGLRDINIAVVGPKTKEAFERVGFRPKIVAGEYVGEGLVSDLKVAVGGRRVLVARASAGRRVLLDELRKVAEVSEVAVYDSLPPRDKGELEDFRKALEKEELDGVIFTSSLMAENLLDYLGSDGLGRLNRIVVCSIGPVTAETLRKRGVEVSCIPEKYTLEDALMEIKKVFSLSRSH